MNAGLAALLSTRILSELSDAIDILVQYQIQVTCLIAGGRPSHYRFHPAACYKLTTAILTIRSQP